MSLSLNINGRWIKAESGQTILDAARANGVHIPTLCDFPGLPSHGSCRMCIVEVKGKPNTPTACTTPVEDGMVVQTETDHVRGLRKDLLRMLLAEHPGCCLFCPENQSCEECMITLRKAGVTTGCRSCPADSSCTLQEMVRETGLDGMGYPVRYRTLAVEREDPFFDRDYNLCVLCGRCIRACETLHFTNIPTLVKRGSDTRVGTSFGLSHLEAGCSFCGACVDVCPTGALWEKTQKWAGVPENRVRSTCPICSIGCEIELIQRDGVVIGALPGEHTASLCVKGRFGVPELVNSPDRMKQVHRIKQGTFLESNWDDACSLAAERLSACSPEDFALAIAASCSNEDLFVAGKFTREVIGSATPVLASAARYGGGWQAVCRLTAGSRSLESLDQADLIVCLGLDARYSQSMVEGFLLRGTKRGAKILTINAHEHVPGRFADLWLKPEPFEEAHLLEDLAAGKTNRDGAAAALQMLRQAEYPVMVVSPDALTRLPEEVERLQAATGAVLVALPAEGNLTGALRFMPQNGAQPSASPRVLYLIGTAVPSEVPPGAFVLYQNTHLPADRTLPGVQSGLTLPMAAFSESDGSLLDHSGRKKMMAAAAAPPGNALPGWQILCRIARAMGRSDFDYQSLEEVQADMAEQARNPMWLSKLPDWLVRPGAEDYLGAPLSTWVEGLRALNLEPREEELHVPVAGK